MGYGEIEPVAAKVAAIDMAEAGFKDGNQLVRELIEGKFVSKYRMAKDLQVNPKTVDKWVDGKGSPKKENYLKLKDYRLYLLKYGKRPPFKPYC